MERIDVDAIASQLNRTRQKGLILDNPDNPSPQQVANWANETGEHTVIIRLAAAMHSAARRGGTHDTGLASSSSFVYIRPIRSVRTSSGTGYRSTIRIEIDSDGGQFSYRRYRMIAIADVTEDTYGCQWWTVRSGSARVSSNSSDPEWSYFGGKLVGQWIADLYFGRLAGRREISWMLQPEASPAEPGQEAPEWHRHVRGQLALLVRRVHEWSITEQDMACPVAMRKYAEDMAGALLLVTESPTSALIAAVDSLVNSGLVSNDQVIASPHGWATHISCTCSSAPAVRTAVDRSIQVLRAA
jgi:hypothetical protein